MIEDLEQVLKSLETEKINPATTNIDKMSPLEIVQVMNSEDAKVILAIQKELPKIARAIEEIAARLRKGGRLIYMGAGTSGRLGVLDASECPPTFSTPEGMVIGWVAGGPEALVRSIEEIEDSAEAGRADAQKLGVSNMDALVGIAASGRTPYVLGAVAYAKEKGALTIGLACNPKTPLERIVDIMIAPVVGPEVIVGSTRLKAGTAEKMVLNMLSTGSMILLGKTYGNLMVDLQPRSSKLRRRAVSILQAATGVSEQEAENILKRSNYNLKVAIIMAKTGLDFDDARRRLQAANGVVRNVLEELGLE